MQNNRKRCVHSHAPPSSLVPFDLHYQYKVCEQILRAGGVSRVMMVSMLSEWKAEQRSSLPSSSFARSQLWISGGQLRGPSTGQYSGQTQDVSICGQASSGGCLRYPASFKSRIETKWNEDPGVGKTRGRGGFYLSEAAALMDSEAMALTASESESRLSRRLCACR